MAELRLMACGLANGQICTIIDLAYVSCRRGWRKRQTTFRLDVVMVAESSVRIGLDLVAFRTHRRLHALSQPRHLFLVRRLRLCLLNLILVPQLFSLEVHSFAQFDELEE